MNVEMTFHPSIDSMLDVRTYVRNVLKPPKMPIENFKSQKEANFKENVIKIVKNQKPGDFLIKMICVTFLNWTNSSYSYYFTGWTMVSG